MGRAIWSATEEAMLGWPARFFVDFFERHGFLTRERPPAVARHSRRLARVRAQAHRGLIVIASACARP